MFFCGNPESGQLTNIIGDWEMKGEWMERHGSGR